MFKLVIQDDEGKTTVVPLIRDEITIGRKEGNTIRLTERNVSRRHARILRNNGEVQIEDLGSYNGIRVNNARIAERVSLRVSDQVQIGDYKLYLKAEGVEQVDDARTMPIERIDVLTPTGTTDVLSAVGTTPTMPMPSAVNVAQGTHPPAAPTAAAQLAGTSNRAMVAIADTDPAGRPVATAAAVAALTAPVGYGKLVVLSSNFAGKEFELSRPQMIIGRTDENDIVINHRSISRNHAKLVREPETGRYTISDLQSSNGVRVNGQDYGKVELRRGDVVDLGHVRLRFVEPGEDFVFARDAVITDVPDVGGKKGLLVAIILGVVVLGGVGAFFALKGGNKPSESAVTAGSGTGASNDGSDGSDTQVVTNPPPVIDAAVIAEVTPDAAVTNAHPGDDIKVECLTLKTSKDWSKLLECADRLATSDQAAAKELHAKAVAENKAEAAKRNMEDSVKTKDFKKARAELDKIPSDSVYRNEAKNAFDSAAQDAMDDYRDRAQSLADSKKCDEMRRVVREADSKGVGDEAHKVTCKPEVIADNPPPPKLDCNKTPNDARCPKQGSGSKPPLDKDCDADALKAKGDEYLSNNQDMAALASFEASMKCKSDPSLLRMAYMAACRAKSWQKAKYYYSKVPPSQSTNITQICLRYGFDPTKP